MPENLDPNMPIPPAPEIHKIEPAQPDVNWSRPDMPRASAERLKAPSSRVKVYNSSPDQVHIVQDRYMTGHELQAGETRELEMLNEDVEYFIRQRQPHPVARIVGGRPVLVTTQHPIEMQDEFGKPLRMREEPPVHAEEVEQASTAPSSVYESGKRRRTT